MSDLWTTATTKSWRKALDRYDDVIARQGVAKLPELDRWYHEELPTTIAARRHPHVRRPDLVRLTESKMARGALRALSLFR